MDIEIKKKKILFATMLGGSAGGSDSCLFLLLRHLDQSKYEPYLLFYKKSILVEELQNIGIKLIHISRRKKINAQLTSSITSSSSNSPARKFHVRKKILKKFDSAKEILGGLKDLIIGLPEIIKLAVIILKNQIDIIHTNHYLTGDRSMLLASILTRKKIVSHNRGLYSPDSIDRILSKYVDQIICMSDFSKSVYVKNGILEHKCRTIYDGIDLMKFNPVDTKHEKITISCIGRIEKWKGQQVLVEAAEIIIQTISKINFIFVGTGDNEEELKILIRNKGLEKYFTFTGHVTNVKDYMNTSTIIVHTSIEPEPFGMVIIEAMALEKPVIATNIGGPLEIIDNEVDGYLIPPQNSSALAEHILKLLKNSSLQTLIGKKAREKVINKFDVNDYARQIEHIYDEMYKLN